MAITFMHRLLLKSAVTKAVKLSNKFFPTCAISLFVIFMYCKSGVNLNRLASIVSQSLSEFSKFISFGNSFKSAETIDNT